MPVSSPRWVNQTRKTTVKGWWRGEEAQGSVLHTLSGHLGALVTHCEGSFPWVGFPWQEARVKD